MSKTDNNTKVQKPKTCRAVTASLALGIFVLVMLLHSLFSGLRPVPPPPIGLSVFAIAGVVLGIVGLVKVSLSKGRLTGYASAVFRIIINGFLIFGFVYSSWDNYTRKEFYSQEFCGANLHRLGSAMKFYASENDDQYPTADKWCDLLLQPVQYIDTPQRFVCKSGRGGRCNYAMNPNAKPNSPSHIVFLFESKPGWNQVGGAELLTTDNHKGKGCNILFNDCNVKFVKTKQLKELKWEVKEGNSGRKSFSK